MVAVLSALGLAIVATTVVLTALRYRELPETIPIHFGLNGAANAYGPRAIVWLPVVIASVAVVSCGLIYPRGGPATAGLIIADSVGLLTLWVVANWLNAAITRTDRLPVLQFWLVMAAVTLAALAAVRAIGL